MLTLRERLFALFALAAGDVATSLGMAVGFLAHRFREGKTDGKRRSTYMEYEGLLKEYREQALRHSGD